MKKHYYWERYFDKFNFGFEICGGWNWNTLGIEFTVAWESWNKAIILDLRIGFLWIGLSVAASESSRE